MLREAAGTYACSICPLLLLSRGARATHENACRRKMERKRARQEEHDAEVLLHAQDQLSVTHDAQGRILWRTEHNRVCQHCEDGGDLLLCSYCNTAWHLGCISLTGRPVGHWMCIECLNAMEGGEDMTSHGAGFDDVEGEQLDPGLEVDADEEGDISDAAFINAGIAPMPDWSPITQAALARSLVVEVPVPAEAHGNSFVIDGMLNRLKSKFACGQKLMMEIDDILQHLCDNPELTFTHTRLRLRALSLEVRSESPELTYKVCYCRTVFICACHHLLYVVCR